MKLNELAEKIESFSPLTLQEPWDHSGFQIRLGNPYLNKILVALEITHAVIDEAIQRGVKIIVTHHPMLFSPITLVDNNNIIGNYIDRLVKADISVYSSHTPFDKCEGGNNDYLGKLLHLNHLKRIVQDQSGFCRCGYVDRDCSILEYIDQISMWLKLDRRLISFTGNLADKVKMVGLCSGAGSDFLEIAKEAGCDLFITGDVKYHTAQLACEMGMNLLDIGHFGSEKIFTENMSAKLRACMEDDIEIIESKVDLNPFVIF